MFKNILIIITNIILISILIVFSGFIFYYQYDLITNYKITTEISHGAGFSRYGGFILSDLKENPLNEKKYYSKSKHNKEVLKEA